MKAHLGANPSPVDCEQEHCKVVHTSEANAQLCNLYSLGKDLVNILEGIREDLYDWRYGR